MDLGPPRKKTPSSYKKEKLQHGLSEPADEMNIVPGVYTSLISACKLPTANYVPVSSKEEETIYDTKIKTIKVLEKPILKGYCLGGAHLFSGASVPKRDFRQVICSRKKYKVLICHHPSLALLSSFSLLNSG